MSSSICKRTLDRFTPCRTEFEPPSKTGSLAGGGVVYLHVEEKSPSLLTPKHRSKASPISRELQCRCIWVGQRFGGFPDLREKVFLSTMPGAVYPAGRGLFFSEFVYLKLLAASESLRPSGAAVKLKHGCHLKLMLHYLPDSWRADRNM
jgi:hypothetical protein